MEKSNNSLNERLRFWLGLYILITLIGMCTPHLALLVILAFIFGWFKCFM